MIGGRGGASRTPSWSGSGLSSLEELQGNGSNRSNLPEELEMQIPMKPVSKDEMLKRVARYKSLKFPADRYPDSQLPGHVRKNILIVGTGLQVDGGKDPMS